MGNQESRIQEGVRRGEKETIENKPNKNQGAGRKTDRQTHTHVYIRMHAHTQENRRDRNDVVSDLVYLAILQNQQRY